jgi:hypothetical protein
VRCPLVLLQAPAMPHWWRATWTQTRAPSKPTTTPSSTSAGWPTPATPRRAGASADGRFTQAAASAWASGLNIGGVTGWRLPGVTPLNGSSFDLSFSSLGTTDVGYDITRTGWGGASEMGYLYYVTLGNDRFALSNTGPFANLDLGDYWSGVLPDPVLDQAFFFNTTGGLQSVASTAFTLGAWAVHDGDVGAPAQPVPEPGSLALLGMAWLVHSGVRRRVGLETGVRHAVRRCAWPALHLRISTKNAADWSAARHDRSFAAGPAFSASAGGELSPGSWMELLDLPEEQRPPRLAELRAARPRAGRRAALHLLSDGARKQRRKVSWQAPCRWQPAESAAPSLAGQHLGPYVLEEPLGQGGGGSVWRARREDGRFEGAVAIKLLHLSLLGRAGAERFRREGHILARLKHPHIASLLDAGVTPGGQPYLVLELVQGERIDRHCDALSLSVEARLELFGDVLAAVAHAHTHGVIHRDLKPGNILVTSEGQVKLLDFGVAKLLDDEAGSGESTELTREGGRALTPEYAAPEQLRGEGVTTATDVYALGRACCISCCAVSTPPHRAAAMPLKRCVPRWIQSRCPLHAV